VRALRAVLQGDFYHWVPLFNRIDEFFDECVKTRKDVCLRVDEGTDPAFPTHSCLQVLRVTSILLENVSNKHLYQSYEVGGDHTAI
jgi:hypothetical protein